MREEMALKVLEMLMEAKPESAGPSHHPAVGHYCVVRTYSAGVHAGIVESVRDGNVTLSGSRRIWRWGNSCLSLSEVSQQGLLPEKSRVACVVPALYLTDAIEIMPASDVARAKIEASDASA